MSHPGRLMGTGFTLIELLVVIAIIGILAGIVLAALGSARTSGTDAARIEDVKSMETAMELYYSNNGTYPHVGSGGIASNITASGNLAAVIVPDGDIGAIPTQLISDGDQYVWANGSYGIRVFLSTGTCKAGINMNPVWWSSAPACSF